MTAQYLDQRLPLRFWYKITVDPATGCWNWTGTINGGGYGNFRYDPSGHAYRKLARTGRAHRFAYERLVGPISEGLQLDHLCRNRRCTNPDHLEPVTQRENILRGESPSARYAAQSHCRNGHRLEESNVYVLMRDGVEHRYCRACRRVIEERRKDSRRTQREATHV